MFNLIIATAHQINLSLMRNGKYGGATIHYCKLCYVYEERALLIIIDTW